ncbi:Sodium/calcium exchanger protein-domain-containing protein [Circinella umbellata]|nr:Sodium/calcium exchanger protein-domain-containing protein [Circinella umbellata]
MVCRNSLSLSLFFSRIIHAMCRRTCRILLIALFLSYFFVAIGKADTVTTANTLVSNTSTAATTDEFVVTLGRNHHHSPPCINIEEYEDQCAFVELACHGFSGMYLKLYYCSSLWKPIIVSLMGIILMLFFGAVSIVASDFFCPNLQTISSKLQLSESMAGVTVLAFGNGSPDLFSTFSAMNSGSGSLAIGELIGAAFFIVAIVSGSMGIIRPFRSERITFMRDATFLAGAVIMMTWIVYHQRIYWYHGIGLVAYYLIYVAVVMLGSVNFQGTSSNTKYEVKSVTEELIDETTRLLGGSGAGTTNSKQSKPPRLSIPVYGFETPGGMSIYENRLGHIIRPMTARSPSRHSFRMETGSINNIPRTTSTSGSISSRLVRYPMTPRVGIRTSLFGAIEFQQHVSAIRRVNSSHYMNQPESANSNNNIRRRQISMPHWKRSPSPSQYIRSPHLNSANNNRNCNNATGVEVGGRPRASTVTGQLLTATSSAVNRGPRYNSSNSNHCYPNQQQQGQQTTVTTPDSTNSSTGLAEDYFTYLSANQHNQLPLEITTTTATNSQRQEGNSPLSHQHNQEHTNDQNHEFMIPEIRLAPPNNLMSATAMTFDQRQQQQQSEYHSNQQEYQEQQDDMNYYNYNSNNNIPRRQFNCTSPINSIYTTPRSLRRNRSRGNSLVVPRSPSIANTEDDVFVSARQSPAVTPSPSMYNTNSHQNDAHAISIILSNADNSNNNSNITSSEYPFVQRTLEAQFAPPAASYQVFNYVVSVVDSVGQTLFPTMQDWCDKSFLAKLSSFVAVPLVLVFTLTLPVAEPEDVKVDGIEVLDDSNIQHNNPMSGGGADEDDMSLLSPDSCAAGGGGNAVSCSKNYLSVASAFENDSMILSDDMISIMDTQDNYQQNEWCRWLLALQAIFGSTFLAFNMAINDFIEPWHLVFGFTAGCMIAVLIMANTSADKPPKWRWMLSFVGFFVALNWIFLLANNMVGLLKAIGMVFNISDAIMGLTVFALGNSIGDLVANTAIAKMGFPTMAISACYAGPLLNMVLGVGISSSYQIFKTGQPFELDIAPTILVSSAGLITVLLSTLIVVNLNGYRINENLGFWMIGIYTICCVINVSLECFSA